MDDYTARYTNVSPSKRSFDQSTTPSISSNTQYYCAHYAIAPEDFTLPQPFHLSYSASKRRLSSPKTSTMLADRDSIMPESFPSFMSVYESEEADIYRPAELEEQPTEKQDALLLLTARPRIPSDTQLHHRPQQHSHRSSITSLFSESAESSPTTTNSTFDSPLVSDNSASTSPESANSILPPTSFRPTTVQDKGQHAPMQLDKHEIANDPRPEIMQDTTKNVKKLTLDMDISAIRRPATTHVPSDLSQPLSAPTSPLKEPMKSARKKPTNLTIRTPGYNQVSFPRSSGIVPPTPSGRPGLHQYQSSPALSSLASPRVGPPSGMFLPLPSLNTSNNGPGSERSSFLGSSMPGLHEESEGQIPKSQEAPERGYTEGPICIYDCGVYLYLEPTAEEARKFDTVINVAKEVGNPFATQPAHEGSVMSVWRDQNPNPACTSMTEPQTAVSEYSFKSAWEWQPPQSTITPSATTPTQSTFTRKPNEPEYVHVRWDHNSEILEDLYPLCKLIDDRVAEHKKVLVHCQLGVSRSASLIIAYGLYKNYRATFHAMYGSVKERSKWVGPNMSLIYQLTDFKNKLNKGDFTSSGKQAKPEWFMRSLGDGLTPSATGSAPAVVPESPAKQAVEQTPIERTPRKRLPSPLLLNKALPPVPLFPQHEQSTLMSSIAKLDDKPLPVAETAIPVKKAASRPLPFRERNIDMTTPEHQPRQFTRTILAPSSTVMDLAINDVPSTPSLFSPRVAEFRAIPFGIRGAGDLETPNNRFSKEIPLKFDWLPLRKDGHVRTASKDPRSPHQEDEAKDIYRSIDQYL